MGIVYAYAALFVFLALAIVGANIPAVRKILKGDEE